MRPKTKAAVLRIKNAIMVGVFSDYVLMDTWFATEPMLQSILKLGLDVIGMVKSQVTNWMTSQAGFIQEMFCDLYWES